MLREEEPLIVLFAQAHGIAELKPSLESVRVSWLHINVQLIDAHTDSHLWAEEYDRDLKDMFAIQSEIAQNVAGVLHVKISPDEKWTIERPPTQITRYEGAPGSGRTYALEHHPLPPAMRRIYLDCHIHTHKSLLIDCMHKCGATAPTDATPTLEVPLK